jgi:hypothetical protein
MKYAVEIDSDSMIYMPSFIKTGSGIIKVMVTVQVCFKCFKIRNVG